MEINQSSSSSSASQILPLGSKSFSDIFASLQVSLFWDLKFVFYVPVSINRTFLNCCRLCCQIRIRKTMMRNSKKTLFQFCKTWTSSVWRLTHSATILVTVCLMNRQYLFCLWLINLLLFGCQNCFSQYKLILCIKCFISFFCNYN